MEKTGQKRLIIAGVVLVLAFFVELLFSPFSSVIAQIGDEVYLPIIAKEYPLLPTPTWTPILPPEPKPVGPIGGTFTALMVDPVNNQIVYGGSYVSGVYKTFNQGETWYEKNNGLGNVKIQSLAIHPTNSSIVYAGTYGGGVYRSNNGGDNWFAINSGGLGDKIVYDLELDPKNPNTVYASTRIPKSLVGYIYKSSNGGASWSLIFTGQKGSFFSSDDYFYEIDVNPSNPSELYLAAHEHGFFKSSNGGQSFYAINSGVNDYSARTIASDKSVPGLIYGGVWHDEAVFRTVNAGNGWLNRRNGLPTNAAIFRLYPDPFTASPMRIFAGTYGNGIYATENRAENWYSVGLNGERIYDFVVANGTPNRWFAATENNGIFRRNAGSSSWSKVMGDLRLNAITSLENDSDNQINYAAVYGKGVYVVDSNGENWLDLTENLNDKAFIDLLSVGNQLLVLSETSLYLQKGSAWIEIDLPTVETKDSKPNKDYLSERIGLPAESVDLHISLANENQLSLNQNVVKSLPYRLISHKDQPYLATLGDGIFRRDGEAWQSIGFASKNIIDLASEGEALFALVCGSDSDCLVYRSVEDEWFGLGKGLEGQAVNRILLSRGELWAGTGTGIYRYDSERSLWLLIAAEGRNILSLTDAGDCGLAAGSDGAVLYSKDCGKSWHEIELETGSYQSLSYLEESEGLILLGSRDAGAFLLRLP